MTSKKEAATGVGSQYLLSDEQMKQYISDGYLILKSSLPRSLHEAIYRKTEDVFEAEGNPGNNLLPRIPALRKVFDDPIVGGALTSILGPNYIMHVHRHPHINPAGSEGRRWHKDSYWGYDKVRYHRNRWAMIFYYPQDVTLENGPTAVMPGTQYDDTLPPDDTSEAGLPICGEAGTFAVVHFDLWHRATSNRTGANRYMMKFQFTRIEEPRARSGNDRASAWGQGPEASNGQRRIVWSQLWDWSNGGATGKGRRDEGAADVSALTRGLEGASESERLEACNRLGDLGETASPAIHALIETLRDEAEPVRLNTAYALGAIGKSAAAAIIETLHDEVGAAQSAAAYALGAIGPSAAPALIDATSSNHERARGYAAFALGDMGAFASDGAVTALAGLVDDPSEWVRRIVAEALGTIARHADAAVPALIAFLKDADDHTRFNAAYSLARFGAAAELAVPALLEALDDSNRYVSGHSIHALKLIGAPKAQNAVTDYLLASRWCPETTKESTY